MAASTAFPPRWRMLSPMKAAVGCAEATIPRTPNASGRRVARPSDPPMLHAPSSIIASSSEQKSDGAPRIRGAPSLVSPCPFPLLGGAGDALPHQRNAFASRQEMLRVHRLEQDAGYLTGALDHMVNFSREDREGN